MIQVYTGNGKGKTTAALGLALRGAGAGFNVYIAQFVKGMLCSEHKALRRFRNVKIEQFGSACFIRHKPRASDIALAHNGLEKVNKLISGKKYRLIILDEINVALNLKLLPIQEVLDMIKHVPEDVEVVLTGRNAPAQIIKQADLVSQVKEIKHYYSRGFRARKGIEF